MLGTRSILQVDKEELKERQRREECNPTSKQKSSRLKNCSETQRDHLRQRRHQPIHMEPAYLLTVFELEKLNRLCMQSHKDVFLCNERARALNLP
eukprot:3973566-Karenia_brevis.AAC.1